jgi:hypothetical protein
MGVFIRGTRNASGSSTRCESARVCTMNGQDNSAGQAVFTAHQAFDVGALEPLLTGHLG